jgi:hypothetical protein
VDKPEERKERAVVAVLVIVVVETGGLLEINSS